MFLIFQRWVLVILVLLSASCGGGGGGGSGGATSSPSITGQVIKGLTAGATVTLYSVTSTGSKTQIAVTTTDSGGNYSFAGRTLTAGQVYVIEATGGSYVDEISGLTTPLTTPLRAVVVGATGETVFALSAISELAVADVESSSAINKWSAALVNQSIVKVKTALGLASLHGTRYFDLATQTASSGSSLTDAQVTFSFYVSIFAGYFHESKQRISNTTLSAAMQNFYSLIIGVERDDLNATYAAGVISAVGKIPALANNLSSIYASMGLPSNATVSQLNSGESSGSVIEPVPSGALKLIDTRGYLYVSDSTTIFNDRGALLGYLKDTGNAAANLTNWSHLGYASVADVYGTAETAIGRWNGGYYFPTGVSYDPSAKLFNRNNTISVPLLKDKAYAAGIPATNVPQCGRLLMSLKGKTKSFTMPSGLTLTLDDTSKINVQYMSGVPHVAHKIILNGSNGLTYSFSNSIYSTINFDTPWSTSALDSSMQFGDNANNATNLSLPNGEALVLTGLLSGDGGKKAVISITSYYDREAPIITAAFAADASLASCADYVFSSGVVSPLPSTGSYVYDYTDFPLYKADLSFFSNGMPDFPGSGLVSTGSVEKSGNASAGIGINMPPFSFSGNTINLPSPYTYRKSDYSSGWPTSGTANYSMIASTPVIFSIGATVLSVKKSIASAMLKIYFDQYPVGTTHANLGTCELTLTEGSTSTLVSSGYIRNGGYCGFGTGAQYGVPYLQGGLDSNPSNYAVIRYKNSIGGWAALLLLRTP